MHNSTKSFVHPGYHEMRTHRRRSVHVSFAVGLVVWFFLRYFSAVGSCLSRYVNSYFVVYFSFTVDALHITFSSRYCLDFFLFRAL